MGGLAWGLGMASSWGVVVKGYGWKGRGEREKREFKRFERFGKRARQENESDKSAFCSMRRKTPNSGRTTRGAGFGRLWPSQRPVLATAAVAPSGSLVDGGSWKGLEEGKNSLGMRIRR